MAAPPFDCIELDKIKIPKSIKGRAGGKAIYYMQVKGKYAFRPSSNAPEFMLSLSAGVTVATMKVGKRPH